jgi:hypothetical protein
MVSDIAVAEAARPAARSADGPRPGDGLLHPIALGAVAVLVLNDHVLKGTFPGALTGKLSDLAGLVVLPFVLLAVLELARWATRHPAPLVGGRAAMVVVALAGIGFAAMKLTPVGAEAYRVGLGLLQWPFAAVAAVAGGHAVAGPVSVSFVADPTDVVVLPILLVPLALTRARVLAGDRPARVRGATVGRPAFDAFSLMIAVIASLLFLGALVDGWAHTHLASSLETVFTPWHGLLYLTAAALYAVLGATLLSGWDGRSLRGAIPAGHGLTYLGAAIFGLAGLADSGWHLVFGIEADAEALVSPTHLLLGIGAGLIAIGTVRASARAADRTGWTARLPQVLGIAVTVGLVGFATHVAHPLVDPWPLFPVAPFPDPMWAVPNLGIAAVALQSAVLAGGVVALERLWPSSRPGALALVILGSQAPLTPLHDRAELLVVVVVAAAAVDIAATWLRHRLGAAALLAIAALAPLTVYGLELVQLADRIRWSPHLLGGWLVVAAVAGALVGLIASLRAAPSRGGDRAGAGLKVDR